MIVGSLFSGIGAPECAWSPLGWEFAWCAEIEAFPSAVLAHHFPAVPNLGDVTKVDWDAVEPVDLLVAGSPCQSFSVAGKRLGLDDARGNLALVTLAIARRLQPRWIVFENVPGLLSSDGGRDFGIFLGHLAECGYGFAYRVLDAQHFGVPQRRRRVFVVGYLGDWRRAAAVLFEPESLSGHPAPSREAGAGVTGALAGVSPGGGWRTGADEAAGGQLIALSPGDRGLSVDQACGGMAIAATLNAGGHSRNPLDETLVPTAESSKRGGASSNPQKDGTGIGKPGDPMFTVGADSRHAIAFDCKAGGDTSFAVGPKVGALRGAGHGGGHAAICFDETQITSAENRCNPQPGDPSHPIPSHGRPPTLAGMSVRRLMPVECERLQGFPDGHTAITYRGKPAADGPRYKAIGNSMAVPVVRWLGERIAHADKAAA